MLRRCWALLGRAVKVEEAVDEMESGVALFEPEPREPSREWVSGEGVVENVDPLLVKCNVHVVKINRTTGIFGPSI